MLLSRVCRKRKPPNPKVAQEKREPDNSMKMEECKRLIEEAFGESSEDDDDDDHLQPYPEASSSNGALSRNGFEAGLLFGENPKWERIDQIKGLSLCRDFLTPDQQLALLSSIEREGWFTEASNNQAMRFGDLPAWASELSTCVREIIQYSDYDSESLDIPNQESDEAACIFPLELLRREPLFNQLIVNSYQPGEGIRAHIDLMRFEDGIALVSLESPCVMHFSRVKKEEEAEDPMLSKIPVYLTPGSLLLISGDARYNWKHEINRKPGFQIWQGQEISQKRRTSITLRKLCKSE